MTRSILALAVVSVLVLASGTALAQKGQGGPKAPKAKVSQPAPKLHTSQAPKAHAPQSPKVQASHGPKVKTTTTATTTVHGPKPATGPQAKTHGKPAATTTVAAAKTKRSDTTRTTTTTTSAGTTVTLSPVQQKLQKNTNLASKLEGRLPKGTDLLLAAEGFRNLGQFVAAVNVSNNLGISFTDLKARMVDDGMSLGQAIQAERNDVGDVTTIVRRAERDAQIVIADTDDATAKTKNAKTAKAPTPKKRDGK